MEPVDILAVPSPFLSSDGGNWDAAGGDLGYVGVAFQTTFGGDAHYGWIEVTSVSSTEIVINQWAYEDQPGVGIAAGAGRVPEPSTAVLLGVLGVGALSRRRRRAD